MWLLDNITKLTDRPSDMKRETEGMREGYEQDRLGVGLGEVVVEGGGGGV